MEQILKELKNLTTKVEKLTEQVVCMQAQKDFPEHNKKYIPHIRSREYYGKE